MSTKLQRKAVRPPSIEYVTGIADSDTNETIRELLTECDEILVYWDIDDKDAMIKQPFINLLVAGLQAAKFDKLQAKSIDDIINILNNIINYNKFKKFEYKYIQISIKNILCPDVTASSTESASSTASISASSTASSTASISASSTASISASISASSTASISVDAYNRHIATKEEARSSQEKRNADRRKFNSRYNVEFYLDCCTADNDIDHEKLANTGCPHCSGCYLLIVDLVDNKQLIECSNLDCTSRCAHINLYYTCKCTNIDGTHKITEYIERTCIEDKCYTCDDYYIAKYQIADGIDCNCASLSPFLQSRSNFIKSFYK
uniref:Uncharacterized protein n=1 Tax=viral metagenome TaxID=1070528 RepID=A0A6C0I116_9ZZZZ